MNYAKIKSFIIFCIAVNLQTVTSDEKLVYKAEKNTLDIKLQGRTSVIFKLNTGADFDIVRKQIVYDFNND